MADRVQEALERTIPELEAYEAHELLTATEIASIVKQRRDYEYLLNRFDPKLLDFKRYVEFEINLYHLIKLRVEKHSAGKHDRDAAAIALKNMHRSFLPGRICNIYSKALNRFKHVESFWIEAIEAAQKLACLAAASRWSARALRYMPRQEILWAVAAEVEMTKGDMPSARQILQRGLRMLQSSRRLWTAYFLLEANYLLTLRKRRALLGISSKKRGKRKRSKISDVDQKQDEAAEAVEAVEVEAEAEASEEDTEKEVDSDEGDVKLLFVVYKNAVNEFGLSKELVSTFIDKAASFFDTLLVPVAIQFCNKVWQEFEARQLVEGVEGIWQAYSVHLFQFSNYYLNAQQHVETEITSERKAVFSKIPVLCSARTLKKVDLLEASERLCLLVFDRALCISETRALREMVAEFSLAQRKRCSDSSERAKLFSTVAEKILLVGWKKTGMNKTDQLTFDGCLLLLDCSSKHLPTCLEICPSNAYLHSLSLEGLGLEQIDAVVENLSSDEFVFEKINYAVVIWLKSFDRLFQDDVDIKSQAFHDRCKASLLYFMKRYSIYADKEKSSSLPTKTQKHQSGQEAFIQLLTGLLKLVSEKTEGVEQGSKNYAPLTLLTAVSKWGLPPRLPSEVFLYVLELLQVDPAAPSMSPCVMRQLLKLATTHQEDDVRLWKRWIEFEKENGDIKQQNAVFNAAKSRSIKITVGV